MVGKQARSLTTERIVFNDWLMSLANSKTLILFHELVTTKSELQCSRNVTVLFAVHRCAEERIFSTVRLVSEMQSAYYMFNRDMQCAKASAKDFAGRSIN
eukprot:6212123-Pleurochrysis_carterae.AAC.1